MRPNLLSIEGLTCFRDRQEIDFANLELFVISGPTGAGKSTLLEAMVFALYGEVPRVDDRSRTEVISASRDRVSVSLDFSVGADRYRIARTLKRRGPSAVVLEKHDGVGFTIPLADQVGAAKEKILQILGLNAAAFKQAVVLPQGEFASFLRANPRERRDMIRSLLGLDIYERMRARAEEAASATRNSVLTLRRILADEYMGVDIAALTALEEGRAKTAHDLEDLRVQRHEASQALERVRGRHSRTTELRLLEVRLRELEGHAPEIDRQRAQVASARRATPLLPLINEADRAADAAATATERAGSARVERASAQSEVDLKAAAQAQARHAAEPIPELRRQIAQLNRVGGRLPEVRQLEEAVARHGVRLNALAAERSALQRAAEVAQKARRHQETAVEAAQRALQESAYDPALAGVLETARSSAIELCLHRQAAEGLRREHATRRGGWADACAAVGPLESAAEKAKRAADETTEAAQAAQASVHRAHLLDAANQLREELEPGRPCPVCEQEVRRPLGAHPNPQLKKLAKALDAALRRQHATNASALAAHAERVRAQARAEAERAALSELERRIAELDSALAETDHRLKRVLGIDLEKFDAPLEKGVIARAAELAEAARGHQRAEEALRIAQQALDKTKAEQANLDERLSEKEAIRELADAERLRSTERLATLREEIAAVTSAPDPEAEAAKVADQIEFLEGSLKRSESEARDAQTRLTIAAEACQQREQAAALAGETAAACAQRRDEALGGAGFATAGAVRAAALPEAETATLAERVRQHEQGRHTVAQQVAALCAELGDERVSDEILAATETLAREVAAQVDAAHGQQKKLEEQVAQMRERLQRCTAQRHQLEVKERELRIGERLAADLRSDRLQAYVLKEAFVELVRGASVRLLALTAQRYSLRFEDDAILVVDHDNAGEARISDTLSGGETFLASLSLAVELSAQVQRAAGAARLDSLFIDEGFGTLDPDTLAVAAETIQNLRMGGRMVGIITHIPELRDEFGHQIVVTKHQGFSTAEVLHR